MVWLFTQFSHLPCARLPRARQRRLCLVFVVALFAFCGAAGLPRESLAAAEGPGRSAPKALAPANPMAPEQQPGSAEGAFRAVLADRAMIELVALCEYPAAGHDWWRPDGSPLRKVPLGAGPKEFTHHRFQGALLREVAFEATLADGAEAELTGLNMTGLGRSNSFTKLADGGKVNQKIRAAIQVRPNSRITLLVHYAPHPWETVCELKHWLTLPKGKRMRAGVALMSHSNASRGVILVAPTEENGGTRMTSAFDLDDLDHREVRIVAVDTHGTEHLADRHYQGNARAAHVLEARFEKLPLDEIEKFLFQSRKFQNIEFRNVSLHAGQKTNFAIAVEGQPDKARSASPAKDNSGTAKANPGR